MQRKILLTQLIHNDAIDFLKKEAEVIIADNTDEETVIKLIHDVDGAIVRVSPFTRKIIEAGNKLKVIGRHGVGLDNIDVKSATELNIPVVYAPGSNTNAVAEHAVSFMLSLAKKTLMAHTALTQNSDYQSRMRIRSSELSDKTVGIVGFGKIGQRVGHICQYGYSTKLLVFDPFLPESARSSISLEFDIADNLEELLRQADFVTLHAPATPENLNLIGRKELSLMKKTAYLVNTGRGELVDEKALFEALSDGTISGAALDVYNPEPPSADNPLFSLSNIIATPHMAAHSEEGLRNMAMMAAKQVLQVLSNEKPSHMANPQVWDNRILN